MGIDNIVERIQSEAAAEAEARRQSAAARAADITARSRLQCDEIRQQLHAQSRADAEICLDRLKTAAEAQSRKDTLSLKHSLLDKAFALAMDKLAALEDTEKAALLARLAANGAMTGQEELVLTPSDHNRIGKKVLEEANKALSAAGQTAGLRLSANPRPLEGGGGLVLHGGDVEVNCSYAALVRGVRDEVSPAAAQALFG